MNQAGSQTITVTTFGGLASELTPTKLPAGPSPLCLDCDFDQIGSVRTRDGLFGPYTYSTDHSNPFNYIKTYQQSDGGCLTLALDSSGNFWQEDVINDPGVLTPFFELITPASYAQSVTEDDREFIAISNLVNGTDIPRTYDGTNFNRLSQVGPGVAPIVSFTETGYTINNITQAGTTGIRRVSWSNGVGLQSGGLGAGNILTIYGEGRTTNLFQTLPGVYPGATVVLAGFSSTFPGTVGGGRSVPYNLNGTYIVQQVTTAVVGGSEICPVFTLIAPAIEATQSNDTGSGGTPTSGWTYQPTLSTLNTNIPIPNLGPGDTVTISGTTTSAYNSTWAVVDELNGSQMNVTNTSLTSNVATYNYTTITGTPIGWQSSYIYTLGRQIIDKNGYVQQVTIAGTSGGSFPSFNTTPGGTTPSDGGVTWTNEGLSNISVIVSGCTNGALGGFSPFNVSNSVIVYADSSTFQVNLTNADISSQAEHGSAVISGTLFTFDTGAIQTASTGGTIIQAGGLSSGVRRAVVLFVTEAGLVTPASTPSQFALTSDASSVIVSVVPTGPPNVVARIVAFTNAGSNGVAGAYYYYIPQNVTTISPLNPNQNITYTSTIINDNISTSATFTFTDALLLESTSIDITGANFFQTIELGSSAGLIAYSNRIFAWGEQNKVTNFVNCSFDGGTSGGYPAGWTVDAVYGADGSVTSSPIFGNSYTMSNPYGVAQPIYGMIEQSAYEDFYEVPIIAIQTKYNVRITASAGFIGGSLVVDLFSPSLNLQYGQASVNTNIMSTDMEMFDLPLLTTIFNQTVPSDLLLRVYATSLEAYNTINVDRIEVYNAAQPILNTQLRGSYVNNFEAFDQITGNLGCATQNQQSIVSCQTLFDQLVILKASSMYSTTDNGITEPYQWSVKEISNKVGCVGLHASDVGEGWIVTADKAGLFLWDGGQPVKISGEIQPTWDSINWTYGNTIWVTNDTVRKRICVGVPLPTPNQWMPTAPTNSNPTIPNVVLMLSYRELNSAAEMQSEGAIRQTFMGTLKAYQLGRKWSIWQIPANYGAYITRPDTTNQLMFCSSVLTIILQQALPYAQFNDNGTAINCQYMSYGLPNSDEQEAKQLGQHRMLNKMIVLDVKGSGKIAVTTYPDNPNSPRPWVSTPQPLADPTAYGDTEIPINRSGYRFFEFFTNQNTVNQWFQLSRIVASLIKEPFTPIRGTNS